MFWPKSVPLNPKIGTGKNYHRKENGLIDFNRPCCLLGWLHHTFKGREYDKAHSAVLSCLPDGNRNIILWNDFESTSKERKKVWNKVMKKLGYTEEYYVSE